MQDFHEILGRARLARVHPGVFAQHVKSYFPFYFILYAMFKSMKWALLILTNVAMARIGGLAALLFTHTNFSVSSGVGFLALFGVSVQTGVIMLEYINQLRVRGHSV